MTTGPVQTRSLEELAADAAARYAAANPLSQASFERSTNYLPGADTRTVNHYDPFPVTIVRGEGSRLHDLDGHVYVDFLNDYTAGLYGHSNPAIRAAIVEAAGRGLTLGAPSRTSRNSPNSSAAAFRPSTACASRIRGRRRTSWRSVWRAP